MSIPSDSSRPSPESPLRGLIDTTTSWGGLVERERLLLQKDDVDPTVQKICSIRVQHLSKKKARYVKNQPPPKLGWLKSFFWVPLVIGDKYYLGNISSIAKHTGLTSNQIKSYAAQGNSKLEREVSTRLKAVAVGIQKLGKISFRSDVSLHTKEETVSSGREFVSVRSSRDGTSTYVRMGDLESLGTPAVLRQASSEGRLVVDPSDPATKGTVSLLGFTAPITAASLLDRAIQQLSTTLKTAASTPAKVDAHVSGVSLPEAEAPLSASQRSPAPSSESTARAGSEPSAMHRAIPIIHDKAQAILTLYQESPTGTMVTRSVVLVRDDREMPIDTALSKDQLQQVLHIAYDSNTTIPPEGLVIDSTRIAGLPTRVLITRSKQGEIDLAITSVAVPVKVASRDKEENQDPLFVGKGAYADVTRVFSLATATLGDVFKAPSVKAPEDRSLLSNEQEKVRLLHQLHPGIAVMEPAKMVVPLGEGVAPAKSVGYLLPRYNLGSLSSAMTSGAIAEMTQEERLVACEKLLSALNDMYTLHLLHGDIKPENILVKRGSDGALLFHFADFGDARWLESNEEHGITRELDMTTLPPPVVRVPAEDDDEEGEPPTLFDTPFTVDYVSETEGRAIYEARLTNNQEAYTRAQHQRDVYAMGCTIVEFLVGRSMVRWEMEGELGEQGYSADVIQACKQMITEDFSVGDKGRPMPDEALKIFQAAMKAPSTT